MCSFRVSFSPYLVVCLVHVECVPDILSGLLTSCRGWRFDDARQRVSLQAGKKGAADEERSRSVTPETPSLSEEGSTDDDEEVCARRGGRGLNM